MAELSDPGRTGYGDNYITAGPTTPTLAMAQGYRDALSVTGENLIGQKPGDDKDQTGPSAPSSASFKVKPSDIKAMEQTILTELRTQVDGFDAFRRLILNTEGWIFLVEEPGQMDASYLGDTEITMEESINAVSGNIDTSEPHKAFTDPDPAATQKIIDAQHSLLRAVGGSYAIVGQWVSHLNNAAQNYAAADKAAFGNGTPNVEGLDKA